MAADADRDRLAAEVARLTGEREAAVNVAECRLATFDLMREDWRRQCEVAREALVAESASRRALRNLLVGACVNEVARVRLAEHEDREAAVDRALGDAAELVGRMVLMPREPGGMQVGMNVRFAVETDGPKLGDLRRRLAALAPPKEQGERHRPLTMPAIRDGLIRRAIDSDDGGSIAASNPNHHSENP